MDHQNFGIPFILKNDLLKVKKYRPITSLLGKQKGVTNLMNTNKILLNTKMFINQWKVFSET